jgi:hypothetical protein
MLSGCALMNDTYRRLHQVFLHACGTSTVAGVGSSHQGEGQLRGQPYMVQQAQGVTLATPGLVLGGRELCWYCLNDIVMGGKSSSQLRLQEGGGLIFSGSVNTTGGGFCSCRTTEPAKGEGEMITKMPSCVPDGATAVVLTLSGTLRSHCFKFTMSAGSKVLDDPDGEFLGEGMRAGQKQRWLAMSRDQRMQTLRSISWQHTLPVAHVQPHEQTQQFKVTLPLSAFSPSLFGQRLQNQQLDVSSVSYVGINAGIFDDKGKPDASYTDGEFELSIHAIEFDY